MSVPRESSGPLSRQVSSHFSQLRMFPNEAQDWRTFSCEPSVCCRLGLIAAAGPGRPSVSPSPQTGFRCIVSIGASVLLRAVRSEVNFLVVAEERARSRVS